MTEIYIVRWKDQSYSLMFGAPEGMLKALDRIGDPADAEVRVVPSEVDSELWLDQVRDGRINLSLDLADIWQRSSKQVWPLEALGS